MFRGGLSGMRGQLPELGFRACQREGFKRPGPTFRVFTDYQEAPEICDQHHSVVLPVPLDLIALGNAGNVFRWGFGLYHAPRRGLDLEGITLRIRGARLAAKLVCGEEPAVGETSAAVTQVDDTAHLGREVSPDVRKQVLQGRIE